MKRGYLFLLLILFPLVTSSPEITFDDNFFQEGEPIIGKITYNDSYKDEIETFRFYKGRRETFFEYDIKFHEDTHYFYIFANRPGEFRIEAYTEYYENTTFRSGTLIKNFTINNSGNNTLEIRPALVDTNIKEKITLRNVGENQLNISYNDLDISLEPLESYTLTATTNKELEFLEIETYKTFNIPIFGYSQIIEENSSNNDLRSSNTSLKFVTSLDSIKETEIELFNFAEYNLTDLEFISSSSMINTEEIKVLEAKDSIKIKISLDPKEEGSFEEFLKITYLDDEENRFNITIPIEIFILPAGTNETELVESSESCSDLGGLICDLGEKCEGRPKFTKGGDYCCVGTCSEVIIEEESENNNLLIGLLIVAALALVGYGVYEKVKKAKPKSPNDRLKDHDKSYSKRVSGGLSRN